MRCFIAVELPSEVRDYLFDLCKGLRGLAKVNWVAKKNIHLTVKFLGDITRDKLEKVKDALKNIKLKSFKVKLGSIGVFPSESFIRVVWVGLEPEDEVINLQKKIDSELLSLISGDQKFISHLTLGRVKFVKNKKEFVKKLKEIKIKDLSFEISDFSLITSELTKDGPKYSVLEAYTLE